MSNKNAEPLSAAQAYWRANIRIVLILLSIWFLLSFGCGLLWVDFFNQFQLGGYPLGFWFAQQGSIYGFVILIFIYVRLMRHLDRRFGLEDDS